jgi:anti-sigma factor RsiW
MTDMRGYVLGALSEENREGLDAQLLADPAMLRAVRDAEEQLIEDYLDGTLAEDEASYFERHFLTVAENRQSLQDACVFRHVMSSVGRPERGTL